MQKPPIGALFDIKPVDDSGSLDLVRMAAVQPVVNLASAGRKKLSVRKPTKQKLQATPEPSSQVLPVTPQPRDAHEEFESAINEATDLQIELAKFGGQTHHLSGRPRYRPIAQPRSEALGSHELEAILTEIHHSRAATAREPESQDISE